MLLCIFHLQSSADIVSLSRCDSIPGRSAKRQAVTISPPQKGGEDMQITANDVFTYTLVIIGIIDLLISIIRLIIDISKKK